ncbi:MAG: hypothetical protein M1332_01665 [Deltaproteobacteria bacterium]|nr:hypothetical protein [Deltaproteobacteria bacterium]
MPFNAANNVVTGEETVFTNRAIGAFNILISIIISILLSGNVESNSTLSGSINPL